MKSLKEKGNEYKCCYCGTTHYNEFENCKNCGSNKYIKAKIDVLNTSNLVDYAEYIKQNLVDYAEYIKQELKRQI